MISGPYRSQPASGACGIRAAHSSGATSSRRAARWPPRPKRARQVAANGDQQRRAALDDERAGPLPEPFTERPANAIHIAPAIRKLLTMKGRISSVAVSKVRACALRIFRCRALFLCPPPAMQPGSAVE